MHNTLSAECTYTCTVGKRIHTHACHWSGARRFCWICYSFRSATQRFCCSLQWCGLKQDWPNLLHELLLVLVDSSDSLPWLLLLCRQSGDTQIQTQGTYYHITLKFHGSKFSWILRIMGHFWNYFNKIFDVLWACNVRYGKLALLQEWGWIVA